MILALLDTAVKAGASRARACATIGLSLRSVQRWDKPGADDDGRSGPRKRPSNALTEHERRLILGTVNSPGFCDLSPKQIVPRLADEGRFLASESTIYRLLRAEDQLVHRGRAKAPTRHHVTEHIATAPNQVWSWDITYLKTTVKGTFYYLYLVEDVWSRKIVGWRVHDEESSELAAQMASEICAALGIDITGLVWHSDNGGPMKGSTMLATLQRLGVVASFSRPSVSDDNPFSEALFRTLKYRPEYPRRPFASLEEARTWVAGFVAWYNHEHLHSSIRFVTPDQRHSGRDVAILAARSRLYEEARRRRPERWSGDTRDWTPVGAVYLNPQQHSAAEHGQAIAECGS